MSRLLAGAAHAGSTAELEQALVHEARALAGISMAALLREDDDGELSVQAADPPAVDPHALNLEQPPAVREALTSEAPLRLDGVAARGLAGVVGLAGSPEALLVVPARTPVHGHRYVLVLADERAAALTGIGVEEVSAFVSAASASLDQAGLLERHAAQSARQASLARTAKALNESLDLTRVLPRICDEAAAILGADVVCVYRGSAASDLVLEASNRSPELIGSRLEPPGGIAARTLAAGHPLLSNQPERGAGHFVGVRSALAAPMRWDGELRGVVWVGHQRQRRVGEDDLALLESFAELAAVACRNASVHAGLAQAARTDALTGCLNHGALQETLRREMQRSRRTGRRLSIVMVDLDHFKQINEEHGHLMGDEVLRRVGRALREAVRPYDFVARYGGDEFTIIAVDAREGRAAEIAERAMARLASALDEALGGTSGPHATAGVAEWSEASSPSELVSHADRALLYGKQQGVRGAAVRSSSVPQDFALGRPFASEDAGRAGGPGPAPWPSAVRRETEPLRKRTRELALASALGARLGEMTRTDEIVQATVDELEDAYGWWRCAVVRSDGPGRLRVLASAPRETPEGIADERRRALGPTEVVERAIAERCTVRSGDIPRSPGAVTRIDAPRSEIAVPIWVAEELWGLLDVQDAARRAFEEADGRLLETVADQLGSALRSAAQYEQLERAYFGTAEALASALEPGGTRGAEHARRVATCAEAVGRQLGMDSDELRDLRYAAVFRNIGEVAVSEATLSKPGPLTDAERSAVERHALAGEQILARVESLAGVRQIVRHSHERWDGRGYPDGLAGERIPPGARVLLVCDAHQAMTSDRPYRAALSEALARAELAEAAGSQFELRVVDAFLAVVGDRQVPAA